MDRIRSIELPPALFVRRVDMSRIGMAAVKIALVLVTVASLALAGVEHAGIAPSFDQQIVLDAQHRLLIHNGASPTCGSIPNPPQHDCFRPGPEPREFSVDYLTPDGIRSLIRFRLPRR